MSIYFGNDTVNDLYVGLTPVSKGYVGTHLFYDGDNTIIDTTYEKYILNTQFSTLYNTAEKPVKSAILKGETLVNLVGEKRLYTISQYKLYGWEFMLPYNLTKGKTYLAVFNATGTISDTNSKVFLMDNDFGSGTGNTTQPNNFTSGYNILKCAATGDNHRVLRIRTQYTTTKDFEVSDVMLIEYQEGMENWDIPYFEGMQSVKMPVLTTTGKQLLNVNDLSNIITTDGTIPTLPTIINAEEGIIQINETSRENRKGYKVKVKPNTDYIGSCHSLGGGQNIRCRILDLQGNKLNSQADFGRNIIYSFNSGDNDYIVVAFTCHTTDYEQVQIALYEGTTQPETYEPYKSNILTVNEDVVLRRNGDVYDELNLLTGRLTQRIDENNEVLSQEVVKTVDLSVVNQDGNNTKLSTFNDLTHVTLSSEALIPEAELEVATKNEEVLSTLSLEMDDISTTQNDLQETSDAQSENVDATMIATTEIYEQLL